MRNLNQVAGELQVGQVVGLFIVGLSEYAVVALWTSWDAEVSKAVQRTSEEQGT